MKSRSRKRFSGLFPGVAAATDSLGYDAGHAERSVNDEALHHFKNVAELL